MEFQNTNIKQENIHIKSTLKILQCFSRNRSVLSVEEMHKLTNISINEIKLIIIILMDKNYLKKYENCEKYALSEFLSH